MLRGTADAFGVGGCSKEPADGSGSRKAPIESIEDRESSMAGPLVFVLLHAAPVPQRDRCRSRLAGRRIAEQMWSSRCGFFHLQRSQNFQLGPRPVDPPSLRWTNPIPDAPATQSWSRPKLVPSPKCQARTRLPCCTLPLWRVGARRPVAAAISSLDLTFSRGINGGVKTRPRNDDTTTPPNLRAPTLKPQPPSPHTPTATPPGARGWADGRPPCWTTAHESLQPN